VFRRPDANGRALLRGLGDRDVAVLALVDRMPGTSVAVAARHLDMRQWRVRRALARLQRRGLVKASAGELRVTEVGKGLGAAALISRLLGEVGPRGVRGLGGSRMRDVEPADRSVASIARLLSGLGRGDRLHLLGRLARAGTNAERAAAVQALGALREPAAAAELGQLVAELGDDGLRAAAAVALGRSGDQLAAPMLRDIVATGSSVMRAAAADALGVLGDGEATEVLATLTAYPSTPVRAAAARALGRIGEPAGVDALAAFLMDADRSVRARARTALLTMDTEGAIETLGANPVRGRLRRARDRRKAQAAQQRRARARGTSPLRLARLDAINLADAVRPFVLGAFVLLVDALVVGVEPIAVVAAVAVLTVAGRLTARDVMYAAETPVGALTRLDLSRPRSRRMPAGAVIESVPVTVIRSFSWTRVSRVGVVAAVALAVDAAAGQLGVAAGLLAGTLAGVAAFDVVGWRRVAAWQRDHGVELLTDAVGAVVPARRYYSRPRE
jgi:DNA-binding MarR family transcriptional regulator